MVRRWSVTPLFAGSNPVVRPFPLCNIISQFQPRGHKVRRMCNVAGLDVAQPMDPYESARAPSIARELKAGRGRLRPASRAQGVDEGRKSA